MYSVYLIFTFWRETRTNGGLWGNWKQFLFAPGGGKLLHPWSHKSDRIVRIENVCVWIAKCICVPIANIFVWIAKWTLVNCKMHFCELQNVFAPGGGHHLHLWSHKSGGGEAIQFQQGEIGRRHTGEQTLVNTGEQTADTCQWCYIWVFFVD